MPGWIEFGWNALLPRLRKTWRWPSPQRHRGAEARHSALDCRTSVSLCLCGHPHFHRHTQMAMGRGPLKHFDGTCIIDPVTHLVLIQSPVRYSGREVIKPGVQKRQIQYEIHGKPVACMPGRQTLTLKQDVRSRNVFPKAVPHHES